MDLFAFVLIESKAIRKEVWVGRYRLRCQRDERKASDGIRFIQDTRPGHPPFVQEFRCAPSLGMRGGVRSRVIGQERR